MGDTGSLVLGFITAVLCIKLLNVNMPAILPHAPVFVFGVVLIPVFDTLRVFALRIWSGKSPFSPDKIHIHHLLTNNGWSHNFTSKMICAIHGLILVLSYFLKNIQQEYGIAILVLSMLLVVLFFKKLKYVHMAPRQTTVPATVTD
jgi:UDP-GlcNAc:undecaprenyl-phosphate/decaprenyl-phosphate GlcNAc-1-phosphate transferase